MTDLTDFPKNHTTSQEPLEVEYLQIIYQVRATSLATVLMKDLCISHHGIDLVYLLSNGRRKDNFGSLVQWIAEHLANPNFNKTLEKEDELDLLGEKLTELILKAKAANDN